MDAGIELYQDPDACAGDGRDAGENAQNLGEGERDERKVRTAQPRWKGQSANRGSHTGAGRDAERESGHAFRPYRVCRMAVA